MSEIKNNTAADPRKNLPSASGMERIRLCRGSRLLESKLTQYEVNDIAETGTRIHNCLAGIEDYLLLDEQDRWVYDRCLQLEAEVVMQICNNDQNLISSLAITGEQRLFLLDEQGNEVTSGQYDKLYLHFGKKFAICNDYKTGYLPVTDPSLNMQARTLAVLIWKEYGIDTVYVSMIQPNCIPQNEICKYEKADLEIAYKEILNLLKTAEDPNAPRTPGLKQCLYCKAKAVCPENQTYMINNLPSVMEAGQKKEIIMVSDDELDLREKLLPGARLAQLLDMSEAIEKTRENLKSEAKLRLKTGRAVPGYALVPGIKRRYIKNNYGLYKKLQQYASPSAILDTMKFTLEKIELTIREATGKKGEGLKTHAKEFIADFVDYNNPDEMLKRK